MVGGKRPNAGRKAIADEDKKKGYKIYLSPELVQDIEAYTGASTFSEKCASLIATQIAEIKQRQNKTVRVIDLFAGLGGIRLGVEQGFKKAGLYTECVFSSEIKKHAITAYKHNFGNEEIYGDITKIPNSDIPDFDFLLAGFPCQPFSSAGKGLGFSDTRGTLFFEIERILREKHPYGFLLENVEGLVNHDGGNTLSVILDHLRKLGYAVSWALLDSQYFGLAQSRKRVYIVGVPGNEPISLSGFEPTTASFGDIMQTGLPTVDSKFTRLLLQHYEPSELYGKSIKDKRGGSENIHSWDIGIKGEVSADQKDLLNIMLKERRKKKWAAEIGIVWMDGMPLTIEQIRTFYDHPKLEEMLEDLVDKGYLTFEHPKEQVDRVRIPDTSKPKGYNIVAGKLSFEFSHILAPDSLAPTLVATDVSHLGVVDGDGVRRLTIREGQRLCGYPEDYDMSMLKQQEAFDLLGNTVCVPVIRAIAERLAHRYIEG